MAKSSKELLGELLAKNNVDAADAKANGELVAWSNAIAPQELLETMNIRAVYTESHAAVVGVRKQAQPFIQRSEEQGYAIDICSYAKINLGYLDIKECAAGNIPMPDLLFCCNNICNTAIKWYENVAKELRIPIVFFDMPFNHEYDVPDHSVKYILGQFKTAIKQLEEISGRKFDYDRLSEVMKLSSEIGRQWKETTALAAAKPSPTNGFDLFNYMGAIISLRGKREGLDLFKLWAKELREKIERGEGTWQDQEEKYRVLWDGIVCWPHLGDTYKILKKYGINIVTATYPVSWPVAYDGDDLESMARAYSSNYVNRNLEFVTDNLVDLVERFGIDGIIYHSNRSCKLMDFRQYEVQRRVRERTGTASVIIDGDQTDTRAFSLAQYETRVQAFVEMLGNGRNGGSNN